MSSPRLRSHHFQPVLRVALPQTLAAGILLAGTVLLGTPAQSQDEQPTGDETTLELTTGGRAAVRLAYPAGEVDEALSGDYLAAAQEIEQTLRDDLAQTKLFDTQGPAELSVLVLTGQRDADFDQYASLGNEVILLTSVSREGDRVVLQGWVYDLDSKQSILGKRYRGTLEQARKVAHTLMDALYYQFMGRHSLALTNFVFQSDRSGYQELFLMDYDGHNQHQISRHKSTSGFSDWSAQNDAIAYLSYFSGTAGIYYVDIAAGGTKVPIYTEGTLNLSPSFSPDGRRVAFASSVESNIDIFLCDRACVAPQRITTSRAIDTNPAWSPDGAQIAFSSSRSGRPHIYVMKIDGSDVRRISFEGDYNEGANWSPDGRHLVYASRQNNRFRVATTDLISLDTKIVAQGPKSYEEPTFSPDGSKIAFTVRQGREAQIFVMDSDGNNWRQLTYEGNNSSPDWSRPQVD
ncbi:MAG: hypothetical protein MPN21_05350 [Thermoanaerobaculia bacterium]|nr:hypothetical protein [Thermoanaerobaculia bacterium]